MKELAVINEIEFGDGKKRYELISSHSYHHHHLVCNSCGIIEEVEFEENILLAQVNRKSNFKIERHQLEFFGLCPNCQ
jgi:Fe2+ or Zn2+ uptake regulation protein